MKVALGANYPGTVLDQYGEVIFNGEALLRAARVVIVDANGDFISSFGGTVAEYTELQERDAAGNLVFEGFAVPGTATSSSLWKIRKRTFDAQNNEISKKWADGVATLTKKWDDRATYTYS